MISRNRIVGASVVVLLSVALLYFALAGEDSDPYISSPPTSGSSGAGATSFRPEDEIVDRLREILQIREEAYQSRDPELLRSIYSSDCPCSSSDERAIMELLDRGHVWKDVATSIEVRSVREVSSRLWVVVAVFGSKPLRIETESGRFVRQEQAGSDLFEFTLVKPAEEPQWLLGLASIVEEG
jgi:hypothetical protein